MIVLKVDVICISRLKNDPCAALVDLYASRIRWPLKIIALESRHKDPKKSQADEAEKICAHISPQAVTISLDERGKSYDSVAFAHKLQAFSDQGQNHIQFIIGGADGLTQAVKDRSQMMLGFGIQTWPHALVRVMLLEQLYRSQQILAGHPYHKA